MLVLYEYGEAPVTLIGRTNFPFIYGDGDFGYGLGSGFGAGPGNDTGNGYGGGEHGDVSGGGVTDFARPLALDRCELLANLMLPAYIRGVE
jgi:hypothetical protein